MVNEIFLTVTNNPSSKHPCVEDRQVEKVDEQKEKHMCAKKKKMIYDSDKWLMPYKDVIDRRHEMIMSLKDRYSVDGSLSKGINNHV